MLYFSRQRPAEIILQNFPLRQLPEHKIKKKLMRAAAFFRASAGGLSKGGRVFVTLVSMNKLKQDQFGKFDILSLVIGSIIGWGSFTLPGSKFLPQAGLLSTVLAFVIGGIAVIFIQAGYHHMMTDQREDGGEFAYTFRYLGPTHGFICGWSLVLCYLSIVPLNATAFVQIFRILFGEKMNWVYLYSIGGTPIYLADVLIATGILLIFTWINLRGVSMSSLVQNLLTVALIAVSFTLFFIMLNISDLQAFKETYLGAGQITFARMAPVLAIVPFLFVGFDVIPQVVTDLGFEQKKASRLAVLGIFSGVLVYSVLSTMTALAYSPEEAVQMEWALGEGILEFLGWPGFIALIIALFAAVSAGINGFLLAATRLFAALADYKMVPETFQTTNRFRVKSHALYFVAGISLIAPWFGRPVIGYIVDMSSVLAALAYFYVCLISFRRVDKLRDKILVGIGMVMSVGFMLLLVIPASPAFLGLEPRIFLGVWILLGFFYYMVYRRKVLKNVDGRLTADNIKDYVSALQDEDPDALSGGSISAGEEEE